MLLQMSTSKNTAMKRFLFGSSMLFIAAALIFMGFKTSDQAMKSNAKSNEAGKKTIVFIRHAKSEWKYEFLHDFDRPLGERGVADAPFMGKVLKKKGIMPDLIIASPSVRTYTTAVTIARQIGYDPENIRLEQSMYRAPKSHYYAAISEVDDSLNTIFVVGHNPATSEIAEELTKKKFDNVVTTGLVAIEFRVDTWDECVAQKGKLLFYDFPKNHPERKEHKKKVKTTKPPK
jgi:phosphohistidine phosphatase